MTELTLEVTEAMPESDYHHKLDKEAREFGEHMTHLAESNYGIATIIMKTRFHTYPFMVDHQTYTRRLSIFYLSSKGIFASSYNGW